MHYHTKLVKNIRNTPHQWPILIKGFSLHDVVMETSRIGHYLHAQAILSLGTKVLLISLWRTVFFSEEVCAAAYRSIFSACRTLCLKLCTLLVDPKTGICHISQKLVQSHRLHRIVALLTTSIDSFEQKRVHLGLGSVIFWHFQRLFQNFQ